MRRVALAAYALIAWFGFLVVVLWAIAWLVGAAPIRSIDDPTTVPAQAAMAIDLALLGVFALHHSVMARPAAKRAVARFLPAVAERSTYVLAADLLLALVLWQWRPLPHPLWHLDGVARVAVLALYGTGWLIAIASTFMIDHFDLVGLRQALSHHYRAPEFQVRWLYRLVRHPLMLGLLIAFWAAPTMTVGHLLFAAAGSAYIAVGVWFEERDLRTALGEPYLDYARHTPAIVPRVRRRVAARVSGATPASRS